VVHTKHARRPKRGSVRSSFSNATKAEQLGVLEKQRPKRHSRTDDRNSDIRPGRSGEKAAEQLRNDFNDRRLVLIKTELDVGFTFASIALQADDENKRLRNCENARKAYDTALHILSTTEVTQGDADGIYEKIAHLKGALIELGEALPQ
jgi:predicted RNA-binding Zn ribbon-like protein